MSEAVLFFQVGILFVLLAAAWIGGSRALVGVSVLLVLFTLGAVFMHWLMALQIFTIAIGNALASKVAKETDRNKAIAETQKAIAPPKASNESWLASNWLWLLIMAAILAWKLDITFSQPLPRPAAPAAQPAPTPPTPVSQPEPRPAFTYRPPPVVQPVQSSTNQSRRHDRDVRNCLSLGSYEEITRCAE